MSISLVLSQRISREELPEELFSRESSRSETKFQSDLVLLLKILGLVQFSVERLSHRSPHFKLMKTCSCMQYPVASSESV